MASIASSVQAIVDEIDAKLAELRPVVDEYNTLEAARAVLIERGAISAPAPRGRPRAAQVARPARAAGRRAPRGANRAAILAFVASNPGATVAQISDATGIAKPTMHSTVYSLRHKGELVAEGAGVALPERATPTASSARRRTAARGAAATGARRQARGRGSRTPATRRAPPASGPNATQQADSSSTAEPLAPDDAG
ncbi:helix-turn-helix domain-containing protein [Conexibacter sp. CPCC 206217]|uniref:MarR family transcriptional regulator n=1 Tax=Conexibacter sp. CPCC 206217 TaxID=3064574 RepID=UPI002721A811|nr:helix-turn-helix domain-containing protein [Conexibacter sp. CPCC 206217]MDO8211000.1 helix-turn-helix domain-containing protein [Conexibacter sp. CPCC 206217]